MVSISNRFLSWDVSSSEICRDIDPRSDGMILGLALSMDDRFAAAYTINKQLVIIDIMLGHYIKVERVRNSQYAERILNRIVKPLHQTLRLWFA